MYAQTPTCFALMLAVLTLANFVHTAPISSVCLQPRPNSKEFQCETTERLYFYKSDEQRCKPFGICADALEALAGTEVNCFDTIEECNTVCMVTTSYSTTTLSQPTSSKKAQEIDSTGDSSGTTDDSIDTTDDTIGDDSIDTTDDTSAVPDITCPPLQNIINGYMSEPVYSVGSNVFYTCHEGFFLVGTSNIECLSDGTWSNDAPQCMATNCPEPSPIDHMSQIINDCLEPDCTATYVCDDGYTLMGQSTGVCNADGKWSSPPPLCARIELQYGGEVVTNSEVNINSGEEKVHIDCVMIPYFYPEGVEPKWKCDKESNGTLPIGSREQMQQQGESSSYQLIFDKVLQAEEHAATYTCVVGELQATVKLNVETTTPTPDTKIHGPVVYVAPMNKSVDVGQTTSFQCVLNGCPSPNITWYHNGQLVGGNERTNLIHANGSDVSICILEIVEVNSSDAGKYSCVGQNKGGSIATDASLTVSTGQSKRSIPKIEDTTSQKMCESKRNSDTVTLVGRVRRYTQPTNDFESYRIRVSRVLHGSSAVAKKKRQLVTAVVTPFAGVRRLQRGSEYIFTGRVLNDKLYVLEGNSVHLHTRELESFAQSC